jgi:glutathione S-transferase
LDASRGTDYRSINGLGLVPALTLPSGEVLTENAAVLQYIAETFPRARLIPGDVGGRARLRQWLSFIGTELHKAVYAPLLERTAPESVKAYALAKAELRLGWLAERLGGHEFLLTDFSIADAYLTTVLTWSSATPLRLERWPVLTAYLTRLQARPSVARALGEELGLYRARRDAQAAPTV